MSGKCKLMAAVLMLGLMVSACKDKSNQENEAAGEDTTPTTQPIGIPSDVPIISIIPDTHNVALAAEDSGSDMGQDEPEKFSYEELSQDIKDRINGKSYSKDCDVPYEELRYVKVLYWGFDNESHQGELIVNKSIAEDIVEIFKELYELKYPIEQMVLVDEYKADDNASMAADNTSSFNYREVDNGSGSLSLHSYGLAIDINPRYNPYVRKVGDKKVVSPDNGLEYADRTLDCPYYINKGDACYKAFTERGFTWGGDWKNTKDYQHFEKKAE